MLIAAVNDELCVTWEPGLPELGGDCDAELDHTTDRTVDHGHRQLNGEAGATSECPVSLAHTSINATATLPWPPPPPPLVYYNHSPSAARSSSSFPAAFIQLYRTLTFLSQSSDLTNIRPHRILYIFLGNISQTLSIDIAVHPSNLLTTTIHRLVLEKARRALREQHQAEAAGAAVRSAIPRRADRIRPGASAALARRPRTALIYYNAFSCLCIGITCIGPFIEERITSAYSIPFMMYPSPTRVAQDILTAARYPTAHTRVALGILRSLNSLIKSERSENLLEEFQYVRLTNIPSLVRSLYKVI
ncbi:hypothetical protein J6590_023096 [Homalodisca vitripennis]|nr:hypothetical protein J6590_023096 [Homalodisca vitripennis]